MRAASAVTGRRPGVGDSVRPRCPASQVRAASDPLASASATPSPVERGDHRRLIAEAEQAGRVAPGRRMDISIRQAGDRQRPIEQRTGAGEPLAQMRTFIHQRVQQAVPSSAGGAQPCARATARTAPPDPLPRAAVRHSRRRTGPARRGGAAPQAARRRARNTSSIPTRPVPRSGRRAPRSSCLPVARNTVSATNRPSEPHSSRSDAVVRFDCADTMAAQHRGAARLRLPQQRLVQRTPRHAARGERQARGAQRDCRAPDAPRVIVDASGQIDTQRSRSSRPPRR